RRGAVHDSPGEGTRPLDLPVHGPAVDAVASSVVDFNHLRNSVAPPRGGHPTGEGLTIELTVGIAANQSVLDLHHAPPHIGLRAAAAGSKRPRCLASMPEVPIGRNGSDKAGRVDRIEPARGGRWRND